MVLTEHHLQTANRRGAAKRAVFPGVQSLRFEAKNKRLVLSLASGLDLAFPSSCMLGLENARAADLADYQISPSGLGIHFPKLDADVYVPALLSDFMGSTRWLAAELGKLGGSKTSAAKSLASKANGRLGGRPRKMQDATEL